MKTLWNILIFLVMITFFPSPVFAELTPLLPEKSLWSVVHDPPAAGKKWTTTYPLPKDRKARGKLDTEDGTWPSAKKYVFMTSELILPDDYEPGNLYARYLHDDGIQIAINGTMVVQNARCGATGWGHMTYTKRVPNLLKPGKNIIAAFGDNSPGGRGLISVALLTDDKPLMKDMMLFAPDSKWSYTHDNPGEGWMLKCPLPKGKLGPAPLDNGGVGDIWLTRIVTLPKEYKPSLLHFEYLCDDEMWLYINGEEIIHRGYSDNWAFVRSVKNLLKPGKNIVAVRSANHDWRDGYIGLDLYLEEKKEDEADSDSEFSMPTRRPKAPEDEEEEEEETPPEDDLTETEKLIVKGMNLLKEGKEKPAVEAFQAAAKADPKDFQAQCILGMLYLTKLYKPALALECMQACVKIDAQDPCVLNNYGVAAAENKKYAVALESWRRLAKNYPTLPELVQNVGFLTELADRKIAKLKDDERQKLETLFREVCSSTDATVDKKAGFLLMRLHDGVGADLNYTEMFVQEFKIGKEKVIGNPYEVKRTVFQK